MMKLMDEIGSASTPLRVLARAPTTFSERLGEDPMPLLARATIHELVILPLPCKRRGVMALQEKRFL